MSRHVKFYETGNSAIRFADPENPTVEPNMKWIGRPLAETYGHLKFLHYGPNERSVGRSVLNVYFLQFYTDLIRTHILLFAMLGT